MEARLHKIIARRAPQGTVVFVHGLRGHPFTTWGGKDVDDQGFWPASLLSHEPTAATFAMYTVSYNPKIMGGADSALSLSELADNVFSSLRTTSGVLDHPIAFVCHSLGGLVIKQMLRTAEQRKATDPHAAALIANFRQIVFLGTPHNGSTLDSARNWYFFKAAPSKIIGRLVDEDDFVHDLNQWYRNYCFSHQDSISTLAFYEKKPTPFFWFFRTIIVPRHSADPYVNGASALAAEGCDHIEISKPKDKTSIVYAEIRDFIANLPGEVIKKKGSGRKPSSTSAQSGQPEIIAPEMEQPSSPWATFGTIAAILALAISLGAFAEGLRRWSRPVIAAPASPSTAVASKAKPQTAPQTTQAAQPIPAPPPSDPEQRRARELKDLDEKMAEAEARRQSLAATQTAIAQAASPEQLEMLATLYPELGPAIDIRRTALAAELAEAKRQQDIAETEAVAELATVTDPARIAEIGARWPALQPLVEARLASLRPEIAKDEPDAKAAMLDRITRATQDGLRRAGCFSGPTTGTWGPKTKKAAETFNTLAKTKIAADAPTEAAETIMKAVKTRVCPVSCDAPKVAVDGKCTVVTCAAGTVPAAGGVCEQAYVAWVGSHESDAGAQALFTGIQQAHIDLIRDRPADIKPAASSQRFSVRIGPAASKDAVRDFCARLKGAGLTAKCYPAPL